MNLGSIYVDFCEPISISKYTKEHMESIPNFDPFKNDKDRMKITNDLGEKIVF